MGKRIGGLTVRVMALVGFVVLFSGVAFAAGEWEWTAGQGWIRGAGVARPTPKEQLHYSYELEQRGEFMDAARQYFLLVQNFPSSEEAGVGLQRLARCLFEMENYYTSYKAIEQVIETYPNTGRMSDLVEIELRIAKKLMVSQTPDLLSDREENIRENNIRRAIEILGSVIEHDPYGPVAAEAYLVKGEGHLFINEVQAARGAFETVRDEFPRSDFVERARYGILQCEYMLGNARPQELADQLDLMRETERERMERLGEEDLDEMDDVEHSIRQLSEVEAGKMLEQAEQYRRMGTRQGVQSSEFLYKEIVRRYPGTPQAEEAMSRASNIKVPKEQSRVAKAIKGINLNPFTYGKDPEPPWIVPQLGADDMVMVDSGLGPIAGVPETGTPGRPSYSVGVRPAGLKDEPPPAGFSPASSAPAPDFVDGTGGQRTVSSDPRYAGGPGGGFGQQYDRPPPPRALPNAPDADLILPPGSVGRNLGGGLSSGFDGGYVHPYQDGGVYGGGGNVGRTSGYDNQPYGGGYAGGQQMQPAPGMPNPNLGRTVDNTPYSDLVGPMADDYNRYNGGGYSPNPSYGGGYPAGQPYNTAPQPPSRPAGGYSNQGGGWSFGDDLR